MLFTTDKLIWVWYCDFALPRVFLVACLFWLYLFELVWCLRFSFGFLMFVILILWWWWVFDCVRWDLCFCFLSAFLGWVLLGLLFWHLVVVWFLVFDVLFVVFVIMVYAIYYIWCFWWVLRDVWGMWVRFIALWCFGVKFV